MQSFVLWPRGETGTPEGSGDTRARSLSGIKESGNPASVKSPDEKLRVQTEWRVRLVVSKVVKGKGEMEDGGEL